MKYIVSDIALNYDPGDEVVGTVEADSPEEAIIAALKAISPTYVADMVRLDPHGFEKHIVSDYTAVPA